MNRMASFLRSATVVLAAACQVDAAHDQPDGEPPEHYWDLDGDGMSDNVETESFNVSIRLLDMNHFQLDPSIAVGSHNNGSLDWGLQFPNEGAEGEYIHYLGDDLPDTDDWGTNQLFFAVEDAGRRYRAESGTCHFLTGFAVRSQMPRLMSGDMSEQNGGYWSDHPGGTHRNGTEVDVRYLKTGSRAYNEQFETLDLANSWERTQYDRVSTMELLQCFADNPQVTLIIYDRDLTNITASDMTRNGSKLYNDAGDDHTDHFHVRVADPDPNQLRAARGRNQ